MSSSKLFNTGPPLAYFLTWTTYGTWLPGDERGWNRRGQVVNQEPNKLFVEMNRSRMAEKEFLLSHVGRETVANVIAKHCEIRCWVLRALSVRSNHVHVVVSADEYAPEAVRDQLKAWGTRRLKEAYPTRKRFWTEGASCRWINHEDDLEAAMIYVNELQDKKDSEIT